MRTGMTCFFPWKMGFGSLGLGFLHWEQEKEFRNGNVLKRVHSRLNQILGLRNVRKLLKVPLLHEIFATRLFRDFEVRIFRDT